MGIAKSIEAYGIYTAYTADTEIFISQLSQQLNADFVVNTYDQNMDLRHPENQMTSFSKTNIYRLTIFFEMNKIAGKSILLPHYQLTIPITYKYEKSLEFVFYPNKVLHICFLTFEHTWAGLIHTLKHQYSKADTEQAKARYQILRSEYALILKKLHIGEICILTHAYYQLENITNMEDYKSPTFADMLRFANEKDKLSAFHLAELMNAQNPATLNPKFDIQPELQILLIDEIAIE